MEEQLVSVETAKLAKEKGLPLELNISGDLTGYSLKSKTIYPSAYKVFQYFPNDEEWLYAPTQSLLQKWLREKYNIIVLVEIFNMGDLEDNEFCYQYLIYDKLDDGDNVHVSINTYQSYEKALEKGLYSALKFI